MAATSGSDPVVSVRSRGLTVLALALAACEAQAPLPAADAAFRPVISTPGGRRVTTIASEAATPPADARYVVAKSRGPVTPALREALARRGYRVLALVPEDALLVERRGDAVAVPGVVAWVPYLPEDRLDRAFGAATARVTDDGEVPVLVHVLPGREAGRVRDRLVAHGGAVVGEGRVGEMTRLSALVPAGETGPAARALATLDEVYFVERPRPLRLLNDKTTGSVQSGQQGPAEDRTPIWQAGLRGEGQIVGVLDTGLDVDSCWFAGDALPATNTWADGYPTAIDAAHRKVLAVDFLYSCEQYPGANRCDSPDAANGWDSQGHGTHIAGAIAGDQDRDPLVHAAADGLAPAARLVMQDAGYLVDACGDLPGIGCPVIDLGPIFAQAYAQGVRIHSNSYGDNENAPIPGGSNYSARAQDVDRFMWEHRDFLIVYAAGNSGAQNRDFSVGSPSTNKNGLAVGSSRRSTSSMSDEDLSSFSSRGWTADGRIKPDLVVPGCNRSAGGNRTVPGPSCSTDAGCGTSYAAPVAAAAAALARQYYLEGFASAGARALADGFVPSAALLKATLLGSTVALTGRDNAGGTLEPIPTNEQGWGRVELDRALLFAGGPRRLYVADQRHGVPAGDDTPFEVTFADVAEGEPLHLTLAWTDYPGQPDSAPAAPAVGDPQSWAAPQLVNDLDLELVGPDGTVWRGNVFEAGASAAGGEADRRNNVEQVRVAAPAAGTYVARVVPHAIVEGDQEFALVATGAWATASDCAPEVPADLVATAASGGAALTWAASAGAGSYRVWVSEGACVAEGFDEAGAASQPAFTVGGLTPGASYQLRVSALSPDGRCESRRSACVAFTMPEPAPDAGSGDRVDAGADERPDAAPGGGEVDDAGGCGCRVAGARDAGAGAWLAALALALHGVWRRRRRRA